jgi:hypothetical protein
MQNNYGNIQTNSFKLLYNYEKKRPRLTLITSSDLMTYILTYIDYSFFFIYNTFYNSPVINIVFQADI